MNRSRHLSWLVCLCLAGIVQGQDESSEISTQIDSYVDSRFESNVDASKNLLSDLKAVGISSATELETALRAPRAAFPDVSEWVGKYTTHTVECYHVDYSTKFLMYVPSDYDPNEAYALVVVGHGGNSSMSAQRAFATANQYLRIYAPGVTENMKAIVVAPASERGWGQIGYSLVFSTVSKVKRMMKIDPNRIYVTGQSMGGHLTYRMALMYSDCFGAVSPHSGGYDYVEKKSIGNLLNVPGMSVFGASEPYGINGDNKTNEVWAKKHGMEWSFVEKNGGHTIYQDELPSMAEFFSDNPRNLYRDTVYFRHGGIMKFTKPWDIKGWPKHTVHSENRPLRWNMKHWIEVQPLEDGSKDVLELLASNLGKNRIEVSSKNVRHLSIYLHPEMVDFSKPVSITVNGIEVFNRNVEPDLALMLDTVRKFDDRGRIFWAKVDLEIETDGEVEIPMID